MKIDLTEQQVKKILAIKEKEFNPMDKATLELYQEVNRLKSINDSLMGKLDDIEAYKANMRYLLKRVHYLEDENKLLKEIKTEIKG